MDVSVSYIFTEISILKCGLNSHFTVHSVIISCNYIIVVVVITVVVVYGRHLCSRHYKPDINQSICR